MNFFSIKPSYKHLYVFRCLWFASTLTRNCSKFCARPCIFLGYPYNTKWQKLYDHNSHTTVISRDVIFHQKISFWSIYFFHVHISNCLTISENHVFYNSQSPSSIPISSLASSSQSNAISDEPTALPNSSLQLSTRIYKQLSYLHNFYYNIAHKRTEESSLSTPISPNVAT